MLALAATLVVAAPAAARETVKTGSPTAVASVALPSAVKDGGAVIAADGMNRSVTSGWGKAELGGAYASSAKQIGTVSAGWANLVSPAAGRMAKMVLGAVSSLDTTSRIDLNLPALPRSGSAAYVTHHVRVSQSGAYAVQVGVGADGGVDVSLQRVAASGAATALAITEGPTIRAGKPLTVALSVVGTNPVTVAAKVWPVGSPEPARWSVTAKDASAARVDDAGGVAAAVYASSRGAVTPVRFDNLIVRSSASAPQAKPQPPVVKPSPVPTQAPEPTPSSKPQPQVPPTAPASYPGKRVNAGAAAPGTVSYTPPVGAVFVATNGSDANPGTLQRPMATLSAATKKVPENGTVVMRGGTYHQDALVYPKRGITIQPYLKEAVWLDGAETVTGWTQSGSVWVKSGWTKFFDSSPTFVKGAPDGTAVGYVWLNPKYPLAAHPDQIWVDDVALTQVASRASVKAGTFFVDRANKQLVLGTNPTGKRVDVSTLQKALSIRSQDGVVRGIGVKRYATSMPQKGAVTADYPGITLDNVMIVDNATTGFHTWAQGVTLRNVTARGNGYMGYSVHDGDGFSATSILSQRNNSQHFNRTPGSGALKVTKTDKVSVRASAFVDNWGQGVWFDDSVTNITFADNDVVGNEGNGLVLEISERAVVANNLIANNGIAGIFVTNTGNVSIWNNTLAGNTQRNINIAEDARRGSSSAAPWITRNVAFVNNVVAGEKGSDCVVCVESWSKTLRGSTMLTQSEGNLYQQTASPRWFALWANGSSGATRLATFADYVTSTGRDKTSSTVQTGSPVDASFRLTAQHAGRAGAAQPVPAAVAGSSSLTQGAKTLGAQPVK